MRRLPMTEAYAGCGDPAHFRSLAACLCVRCYNMADRWLDWSPICKPVAREPGGLFAETVTTQGSLI